MNMNNDWKKQFSQAFLEITNKSNWIDGKPVYKGYKYVTIYNALENVVESLLDKQIEEIEGMKLKFVINKWAKPYNQAISDVLTKLKG